MQRNFLSINLLPWLPMAALILCTLFIPSCMEDPKPKKENILGLWKIDRALRNGKLTNSLDGLYMYFEKDFTFESNLLGDTSSFSSIVEGSKIKIDHNLIRHFDIQELNDSLLKLETEINEDELLFVLKR